MYKKTKLSKYLNILVNVVVLIASYLYIIWSFSNKTNKFNFSGFDFLQITWLNSILLLLLISTLTFINWAIETIKWQILIEPIEKISFKKSYKSILIGLFTSLFMPNRSGEWIGRIFSISNVNKGALFIHTLIGNFIQYLVTFLVGLFSMLYFIDLNTHILNNLELNFYYLAFFASGLFTILVLFFILFFFNVIRGLWAEKLKNKIRNAIKNVKALSLKVVTKLFLLSILRYVSFSLQYVILFYAFDLFIDPIDLIMQLGLYFFILSIIPTIVISEIGVRGSLSIIIFSSYCEFYGHQFSNLVPLVFFISLLVWVCNIIIPSIIGSFFISKFKLFGKWSI